MRNLFTFSILFLCYTLSYAQGVGIGTVSPNPSAKLDISASDKGLLIPRVNLVSPNSPAPVSSPAVGLMVYNLNASFPTGDGFYFWQGTSWIKFSTAVPGNFIQNQNTAAQTANLWIDGNAHSNSAQVDNLGGTGTQMVITDNNGHLGTLPLPTDAQTLSVSGQNLTISNGNTVALPSAPIYTAGTGINVTGTTIINTGDADADPANEIQTLSQVGNVVSLTNGGSVTLPSAPVYTAGTGINVTGTTIINTGDADADPANEIQTLSQVGNVVSLSQAGGSFTIPTEVDGDITNEIQTLSLSGNVVSLTNGGSVTLPSAPVYTAGTGINVTGTTIINTGDADADPANEIQTLSQVGNVVSLSQAGGSFTIPTEVDGDVTNELQTLSLSGNVVSLTNGGSVTLPSAPVYTAGTGINVTGTTIINTGDADADPANEIQTLSQVGNVVSLTNGGSVTLPSAPVYTAGTGINVTGTTIINTGDADADPANEIQTLSQVGNVVSLSQAGGSFTIPTEVDGDVTNELQTLSQVGNVVSLSQSGGSFTIPTEVDGDVTNELQTLSLSGNVVSLTNGGFVTLPSAPVYTAGTGINVTGTTIINTGDADADPSNEIQTLSQVGNVVSLSQAGGSFTIPTEVDGDVTNELQTLSQIGNVVSLSQSGGSFTIPTEVDGDITNEIQTLSLSGNVVSLTNGGSVTLPSAPVYTAGTGINVTGTTIINTGDADADPANEIQTLSQVGNVVSLSQAGGTFTIPTEVDGDVTNELQTLSQVGNVVSLSQSGGSFTIPTEVDGDVTNEIQTLSLSGNVVSLTNGGSVTLPSAPVYTAGTGINVTGTTIINTGDADADPANEIQTLSQVGNVVSLSQAGGSFTIPTEVDGDVTNEIQTLSLSGNVVSLTNGGSVTLPSAPVYTAGTGINVTGTTIINTGDADADPANEIQTLSQVGNVVSLSQAGGSFTIPTEVDGDVTNEIQTLSLSGNVVSLTNGGSVTLPSAPVYTAGTGINVTGTTIINTGDADADPSNEIQTLSQVGNVVSLSQSGGSFTIPTEVDGDVTNELQTLSLSGNVVSLTNGGSVTLPSAPVYTAGTGINVTGTTIINTGDADADPANEIQTLSQVGNVVSLSQAGGSFTIPTEVDGDITNELQTLSLSGNVVSLTNGGSVTLPSAPVYTAGTGINVTGTTIINTGDADADPSNEIQTLSLAGNVVSLTNGGSVTLPSAPVYTAGTGINVTGTTIINTGDADADPANEIQTLSQIGNVVSLSQAGGSFTIPTEVDGDITNEIQTLSLSGNVVSLTNGGSVTLPSAPVYTAGTGINVTGTTIINTGDADADPANEIQTLSQSGNVVSLSQAGGSFTIPTEVDGDVTNEIQNLSVSGGNLNISGGGTGIPLTSLDAQTLSVSGQNLTISNGNTVALPSAPVYTGGAAITINSNAVAVNYDNTSVGLNGSGQLEVKNYLPATRTLTINGTANQVSITPSGAQDLSTDRTWTVSTPQDIHTAATPTFSALTLTSNNVNGGIVYTNAAGNLNTTTAGTVGQVLQSNGAAAPTWVTPTMGTVSSVSGTSPINVANGTSTPVISLGTVPVANGGTGLTSVVTNGLLYGAGTGNLNVTASPLAAQVLLGNGAGIPTFTTVSGDATISSTGVITLNQNNNGYIKNQTSQQASSNFNISGSGVIGVGLNVGAGATIDNSNGNTGTINTNALAFGSSSGEGIGSKRNAGGNQYGLDFYTNFLNRMAITSAGNVGIGTTAPGATLNVIHQTANTTPTKPTGNWAAIIENNQDAADNRNGLAVATRWGGTGSTVFEAASYWSGSAQAYTPILTVKGDRNVGIGNSAPAYKLDVSGDINFTSTVKFGGVNVLFNNSGDVYGNIRVLQNNSTSLQDGMYINYNSTGGAGSHLRFYANGTTERMRIDASSGNVGIATSTPNVKLAINGAGVNVYNTDLWAENNIHIQGNETLTQGGRGRLRVGTAWNYIGLYAEPSSTSVNNDLVLGSSSGLVRIGANGGGQQLKVGSLEGTGGRTVIADANGILRTDNKSTTTTANWTTVTAGTNWVVPAGVYRINVLVIGGGGGSANCFSNCASGGAGGAVMGTLPVTPGETLTIVVGSGGSGGTNGGGGGGSAIKRGATILCAGGGGGGGSWNSSSDWGNPGGVSFGTSINGAGASSGAGHVAGGNNNIDYLQTPISLLGFYGSTGNAYNFISSFFYIQTGPNGNSNIGRGGRGSYGDAGQPGSVYINY